MMPQQSQINFVRQQGLSESNGSECEFQYPALMFQPRLIGAIVLAGVLFQAAPVFLAMAAVLIWNVVLPRWNLFDALYNQFVAKPKGKALIAPARAPRRFSQAIAATFMLIIGASLLMNWRALAWTFEVLLLIALSSLIFGKFCLGSYLFYTLTGKGKFANETLPWSKGG